MVALKLNILIFKCVVYLVKFTLTNNRFGPEDIFPACLTKVLTPVTYFYGK